MTAQSAVTVQGALISQNSETAQNAVDDCWNRIGVQGDTTCKELVAHVHCRNCPVYSAAARQLLDVSPSQKYCEHWTGHFAKRRSEVDGTNDESALVFRCGDEWLALPLATCSEVAAVRAIHTLPHRRNRAALGLVNVRGELIPCLSLAALLGTNADQTVSSGRLLVIANEGVRTALLVNEVCGIHRFDKGTPTPLPTQLAATSTLHAAFTLRWRNHTVGLLDERALAATVTRSLA